MSPFDASTNQHPRAKWFVALDTLFSFPSPAPPPTNVEENRRTQRATLSLGATDSCVEPNAVGLVCTEVVSLQSARSDARLPRDTTVLDNLSTLRRYVSHPIPLLPVLLLGLTHCF